MKLISSNKYEKEASKVLKRDPALREKLRHTLLTLQMDIFHPALKTHKLKGILEGLWSSSIAYDLRIIFEISEINGEKVIQLHSIGTHDEVY